MRLGTGTLAAMLARHHAGAAAGTGHTETVQATRPDAPPGGVRPYLRAAALAAVAMGGLALNASVSAPASAAEGPRGAIVRLAQGGTSSPPLLLMQPGAMDRWAAGTPVAMTDLREGSATFGEGTGSAAERQRRVDAYDKTASHMEWTAAEAQVGLALSADASSDPVAVCRIVVGGGPMALSAADKSVAFAQVRGENPGSRISRHLTDWQFDNWSAAHELGHCKDPGTREEYLRAARGEPGPLSRQSYARYRMEARADAYAALFTAAAEGHTRTAEAVADLRLVGSVNSGSAGSGGVTTSASSGDAVKNVGAEYLTTPAVDAAVAMARSLGTERLRALSPRKMADLAERAASSVELSPQAFARVSDALADTRLRAGRIELSPDLPSDLAQRYGRAARAVGFVPRPGDFFDAAVVPPTREARGAAPGPLAAPGMERARAALAEDLRQAREVLSATRGRDGAVTLRFLERGGAGSLPTILNGGAPEARPVTTVTVARDGSVTRLDANGRLSSLSETRPAMVRGGVVTHALPGGDRLPTLMSEAQGKILMEARAPAAPEGTFANLGVLGGAGEERDILRRALQGDLSAGATPVRMEARPGGRSWRVAFREADGSSTSAVVRADGAVARFGADGKQMTIDLDPMRPAARGADGRARHVLFENGSPRVAEEREVRDLHDARAEMRDAAAAAFEGGGGALSLPERAPGSLAAR